MEYNKHIIINGLKMLKGFLNLFRLDDFSNLIDATIYMIESYVDEDEIITLKG